MLIFSLFYCPSFVKSTKHILAVLFTGITFLTGYTQEDSDQFSSEIFTIVEKNAEFIGGQEALYEYLAKHLSYPAGAKEAGIQGIVYVTFVIIETGKVTDVKILRGIGGGCDEEAVRVVRNMPYWISGTQRGKKVKVHCNLPIRFSLAPNKKEGWFKRNR